MKSQKVTCWSELARCQAIGIDVSKKTLEVAGLNGISEAYSGQVANTAEAIGDFIKSLAGGRFQGTIVCEATSHYHLVLAVMACEAGLDIRVVNPLLSSKHAKSAIRKTKTDKVDAQVLATMVLTEPKLPPRLNLSREMCQVRHTLGLIQAMEKHLQGLTRSLASYRERVGQLDCTVADGFHEAFDAVSHLRDSHEQLLSGLAQALMAGAPDQTETIERAEAVYGVTRSNAALFACTLDKTARSAKSWIAYAGLDVAVKESGTWRGHGKLTKRGPAWLRKRLFQAAWGAALNYPQARLYYDMLKAKGRKHKEAVVIMAKKLLSILYAVIVHRETFDPAKAFQIAH
jgi:transposase